MALPTASDNPFPSLLITEGTVPATPASGKRRLYVNSTTHAPKLVNSSGVEAYFPGQELAHVEFTSSVNITATAEASANSIVSAGAVTFDGNTAVIIEFFAPYVNPAAGSTHNLDIFLYDGTSIGYWGYFQASAAGAAYAPCFLRRKLTPSAGSHTYSARGIVDAGTGVITAGAGGVGANIPGYIRITAA